MNATRPDVHWRVVRTVSVPAHAGPEVDSLPESDELRPLNLLPPPAPSGCGREPGRDWKVTRCLGVAYSHRCLRGEAATRLWCGLSRAPGGSEDLRPFCARDDPRVVTMV